MQEWYTFLTKLGRPVAVYGLTCPADLGRSHRREMMDVVRKETCPACKGNRWVTLKDQTGRDVNRKCPSCGGQGYKIRLARV